MKFRKKPVTIEARQLTGDTANDHDIYLWVESGNGGSFEPTPFILGLETPTWGVSIDPRDGAFLIATPQGVMAANKGDWIIRDENGEFYSFTPFTFEATYEPVEDEQD